MRTGEIGLARLSPPNYLNSVINIIQKRALRSSKVDWSIVRTESLRLADGARSTADTYAAINYVLSQLGDNHSFLKSRTGSSTRPPNSLAQPNRQQRVNCETLIYAGGKRFGFLVVSSFGGTNKAATAVNFALSLQTRIAEISHEDLAGWIIDLRGNTGGNMWPMLVGVGPLIGTGILGFFVYPHISIPWFYENGQAGVINQLGRRANFKLESSIADCSSARVVVLVDEATASSAEALTISFKGRPDTCIIGKTTCGLATNNESIRLPDGATLCLTTSGEADRNLVPYDSGIKPDIFIDQGDEPFGSKDDPGILAAIEWLNRDSS